MSIRVLLMSYIFVFCAAVFAGEVAIVNPGFEDPVIADGGFGYQDPNIPGWTKDKPASVYRIYNPFDSYEIQPVEGDNFLFLAPAGASASLSQITTETIQAGMVYEFSVSIGCLSANFGDNTAEDAYYVVALYTVAGAVQQAIYTSGAVAVESPSWTTLKVRLNSAANPAMVGKNIRIIFGGKMVMFDDVKITYGSLKQLTIQASPANAGIDSVSPVVGTYACYQGETVDLEAFSYVFCPDIYTFNGWSGDVANADLPMTEIVMDADKTITANFVLDTRKCEQMPTDITFDNPGFELPDVAEGGYQFVTDLPGWNIDANDVTYTVYNSSSSFKATEGDNHIAMQLAGAGSGQISQILSGEIKANTLYYFEFDVAAHDLAGYYLFSLYYSPKTTSHLLETTGVTYLTSTYQWNTVTVSWDSSASPELVGQRFEVALAGKKILFDNLRCYEQEGVSVSNPGFERPLVPDGGYQIVKSIPGWNIDANDVTYTVYDSISTATFKATQGENHIAFQLAGAGSGQISQIPAGTIQADTVYTFKFDVAAYNTTGSYQLSLYYAPRSTSHLLATTGLCYLTATYQWNTISLVWDSATHPELIGQRFEIILSGKKMFFDNFVATPAGTWGAMMNLSVSTDPAGLMDHIRPAIAESEYKYGDTVNITAATGAIVCPDRYVFEGWTENGVELADDYALTMPMNGDKVITARYSVDPDYAPQCGSVCRPIQDGDVNRDCGINMDDFAVLAVYWLETVD